MNIVMFVWVDLVLLVMQLNLLLSSPLYIFPFTIPPVDLAYDRFLAFDKRLQGINANRPFLLMFAPRLIVVFDDGIDRPIELIARFRRSCSLSRSFLSLCRVSD
ncbi:hypothetical protein [Phormidesmis priestleyi]